MSGARSCKNWEDDLKKNKVPNDFIPVWYIDTVREFITNYCPDMHPLNKALLLEMLYDVERREERKSKVIELKREVPCD
jgi:hypothetical protein